MKLRLKVKGKKSGIVGSALTDFWSYVILVFVVVIFFVFFGITAAKGVEKVIDKDGKLNTDVYVVNYLRVPVDIEIEDGKVFIAQDTNLADFLVEKGGPLYLAGDRPGQLIVEIDEIVNANDANFETFKILVGNVECVYGYGVEGCPECFYDSKGDWCIPSYYDKFEGSAILPLLVRPGELKFLKVLVSEKLSLGLY